MEPVPAVATPPPLVMFRFSPREAIPCFDMPAVVLPPGAPDAGYALMPLPECYLPHALLEQLRSEQEGPSDQPTTEKQPPLEGDRPIDRSLLERPHVPMHPQHVTAILDPYLPSQCEVCRVLGAVIRLH